MRPAVQFEVVARDKGPTRNELTKLRSYDAGIGRAKDIPATADDRKLSKDRSVIDSGGDARVILLCALDTGFTNFREPVGRRRSVPVKSGTMSVCRLRSR